MKRARLLLWLVIAAAIGASCACGVLMGRCSPKGCLAGACYDLDKDGGP